MKESGAAFAGPTYFYIVMLVILITTGLYRIFVQHVGPIPDSILSTEAREIREGAKALGLLMLLRAFSSGAVALSGVEAISNGVPAFERPESRNASTTLLWMGSILGTCFFGVSVLASHLKPYRGEHDGNGLGLMAEYLYGGKGVMFWLTMIGTFLILILAANTAYADFPRLASIVARDGFLPRQFFNKGARLVFSNGVLFLAIIAGVLIVAFNGDISKLIPLYAFGVFTGFTLSQTGMVIHHRRDAPVTGGQECSINGIGAVTTGVIAAIVVISKFTEGAWIPALLIPIMVFGFRAIGRHYDESREAVRAEPGYRPQRETHTMVVRHQQQCRREHRECRRCVWRPCRRDHAEQRPFDASEQRVDLGGKRLAIDALDAPATIVNARGGIITGFVDLTGNADLFTNKKGGTFEARLTSDFGNGERPVRKSRHGPHRRQQERQPRTLAFVGLERFENSGTISLVDGREGDIFQIAEHGWRHRASTSRPPTARRSLSTPSSAAVARPPTISSSTAT